MMEIQAIDKATVHKICSGQVVLTLAVAVKELVENAIDAGSSSIEVRLRDYGGKMIEVVDNGLGVEEKNFKGLTLKHHTSKIANFGDLEEGVTTFGFRGEALSSLCALSKLSITTRHKDAKAATRIQYDHHGRIDEKTLCARQAGTTVTLEDLFITLPVRHKEFTRNLKKEFHKMISLLNAYCIISSGVKITCYNQSGATGKKSVIVSTQGSLNMIENISAVFGSKQLGTLKSFVLQTPSSEELEEFHCKLLPDESQSIIISGYVSTCEHGSGRGSVDRQYYYINGRPCVIEKLSRLVNEVYHSYNKHQYPCVFLNIQVDKGTVDVNVTPDKRKVFLDYEPILLATVKTSLIKLWEPESSTYTQQSTPSMLKMCQNARDSKIDGKGAAKRTLSEIYTKVKEEQIVKKSEFISLPKRKQTVNFGFEGWRMQHESSLFSYMKRLPKSDLGDTPHCEYLSANIDLHTGASSLIVKECLADFTEPKHPSEGSGLSKSLSNNTLSSTADYSSASDFHCCDNSEKEKDSPHSQENRSPDTLQCEQILATEHSDCLHVSNDTQVKSFHHTSSSNNAEHKTRDTFSTDCGMPDDNFIYLTSAKKNADAVLMDEPVAITMRKTTTVSFSLASIKQKHACHSTTSHTTQIECPKFRAKIAPDQNGAAENELSRSISKSDFGNMEVLGQFNHGFIISRLRDDLFIIDQHATDEKYNFEMLQKHTVMKRQTLLVPKPLGLCSTNELLLMDNLDVFHKNGFEFAINPEAEPTMRVSLKTQPVSKNWSFGKDDIDEILYMLKEAPERSFRPSRVRAMFASRACRKSVMIGKPLGRHEMGTLIRHMGEIEQPWNCPHGRPTMRHLVNLDLITD